MSPETRPLFHIMAAHAWATTRGAGEYRPPSLSSEGFVHCSYAEQVQRVANARYRDATGLCVVQLDPALLGAPVRVEDSYGVGESFPHVYGPIPTAAATAVHPLVRSPAGEWRFSAPAEPTVAPARLLSGPGDDASADR